MDWSLILLVAGLFHVIFMSIGVFKDYKNSDGYIATYDEENSFKFAKACLSLQLTQIAVVTIELILFLIYYFCAEN